jgi:hypothetical protein
MKHQTIVPVLNQSVTAAWRMFSYTPQKITCLPEESQGKNTGRYQVSTFGMFKAQAQ